jgi:hypothetical protein
LSTQTVPPNSSRQPRLGPPQRSQARWWDLPKSPPARGTLRDPIPPTNLPLLHPRTPGLLLLSHLALPVRQALGRRLIIPQRGRRATSGQRAPVLLSFQSTQGGFLGKDRYPRQATRRLPTRRATLRSWPAARPIMLVPDSPRFFRLLRTSLLRPMNTLTLTPTNHIMNPTTTRLSLRRIPWMSWWRTQDASARSRTWRSPTPVSKLSIAPSSDSSGNRQPN